jgi:hypothetical protein
VAGTTRHPAFGTRAGPPPPITRLRPSDAGAAESSLLTRPSPPSVPLSSQNTPEWCPADGRDRGAAAEYSVTFSYLR